MRTPLDGVYMDTECAQCGAGIDVSEWHPAATIEDWDEGFRVLSFCSEECREAWQDEPAAGRTTSAAGD